MREAMTRVKRREREQSAQTKILQAQTTSATLYEQENDETPISVLKCHIVNEFKEQYRVHYCKTNVKCNNNTKDDYDDDDS